MGTVIAVANQKGGVGKTTVTVNLGAALAERGKKVLLIDLDPQGNLTMAVGLNPPELKETVYDLLVKPEQVAAKVVQHLPHQEGVEIIPANIDLSGAELELVGKVGREQILKEHIAEIEGSYDYILIDCSPSLSVLTVNALTAAGFVLIPVECEYFALKGMERLLSTIREVKRRVNHRLEIIGIVPNKYDPRTLHSREVMEVMEREYGDLLIRVSIRRRISLVDAAVGARSVIEYSRHSDVAESFRQLAEVIDAKAS